jgi:hypothetical protein
MACQFVSKEDFLVKINSTMRGEDRVWICPLCGQEWSDGLAYRIGTLNTAYWAVAAHERSCRVEIMLNEAGNHRGLVKAYCPLEGRPLNQLLNFTIDF